MPAPRFSRGEPGSLRRALATGLRVTADRFAPAPAAPPSDTTRGLLVRLGGRWYPSARLLRDAPSEPQPPELG